MAIIFTISNNKGGVSKTSTTKNLAVAMSKYGKTAVIDMDDQQNLASSYHISYPYDLLENDLDKAKKQAGYDFIFIDTPPELGQETVNSYLVSDYIIIPTNLAGFAIDGMTKTIEAIQKIQDYNPKLELLGVLISSFDRRDRESDKLLRELQNSIGKILFDSVIKISSTIKKADDNRTFVQDYEKNSWTKKSTHDFEKLALEITKKINYGK